ncbi:MAG: InlB B-repeat-containing protein, partial [Oscillospiraceae bacterium]|nr:InlB B-repeat-containing protein [Oscillospiraceae bacterium]
MAQTISKLGRKTLALLLAILMIIPATVDALASNNEETYESEIIEMLQEESGEELPEIPFAPLSRESEAGLLEIHFTTEDDIALDGLQVYMFAEAEWGDVLLNGESDASGELAFYDVEAGEYRLFVGNLPEDAAPDGEDWEPVTQEELEELNLAGLDINALGSNEPIGYYKDFALYEFELPIEIYIIKITDEGDTSSEEEEEEEPNESFTVTYFYPDGYDESELIEAGDIAPEKTVDPEDFGKEVFRGWFLNQVPDLDEMPYVFSTPVTEDLDLYAVCDYYMVSHYSNGVKLEHQWVESGGYALTPPNPTARPGYTFAGWKDGNGNTFVFNNTPITEDTIITAAWTGNTVNFSIAIWMEKANFSGTPTPGNFADYDYITVVSGVTGLTGTAGQMSNININGSQVRNGTTNITTITNYFALDTTTNFPNVPLKYAQPQYAQNAEILGNGQTVINLFASRKLYTYRYVLSGSQVMLYDPDGLIYGGTGTRLELQLKYEQDVTNIMPWAYTSATPGDPGYRGVNATFGITTPTNGNTLRGWSPSTTGFTGGATLGLRSTIIAPRLALTRQLLPTNGNNTGVIVYTSSFGTMPEDYHYRYFVEYMEGEHIEGVTTLPDGSIFTNETPRAWSPDSPTGKVYLLMENLNIATWNNFTTAQNILGLTPTTTGYASNANRRYQYPNNGDFTNTNTGSVRYYCYYYNYTTKHTLTYNMNIQGYTSVINNTPANRSGLVYMQTIDHYEPLIDPSRDDCTFEGWYGDPGFVNEFDWTRLMPDNSVTVYAKWGSKDHTVKFFNRIGDVTPIRTQGVATDSYAQSWTGIYYPGQYYAGMGIFLRWEYEVIHNNPAIMAPFSFGEPITRDYNVYAMWEQVDFEIIYENLHGATNSNPTMFKAIDLDITLVEPGERKGYTFTGWYTDATFTTPLTVIDVLKDWTVYAKWGEHGNDPDTYTITYENLQGATNHSSNPETFTILELDITLQPPTRARHMFDGWYLDFDEQLDEFADQVTEIDDIGDWTVYAKWIPIDPFTLIVEDGEGKNVPTHDYSDGNWDVYHVQDGKNSGDLDFIVPTGWTTQDSTDALQVGDSITYTNGTDEAIVWYWPVASLTVTVEGGNGAAQVYAWDMGEDDLGLDVTWLIDIDYGGGSRWYKIVLAPDSGYMLDEMIVTGGAYDGDSNGVFTFTDSATYVVTIPYKEIIYNITYAHLQGGSNAPANPETFTVEDLPITLMGAARDGYNFDGWFIFDADISGYIGPVTQISTIGDVTLYAKWKKNLDLWVTVTFDVGDKGTTDDKVEYELIKGVDTYPTEPSVTANKGWTFIGWFDEDDNEYDLSGTVPNDAEDAAYTAKYEEKAEDRITVTFDVGDNGYTNDNVSYNLIKGIDEYPTAPDVTANKGWTFLGWFDSDDNEYDLSGIVPKDAEDAEYTAKYEEKAEDRITVTFDVGINGTTSDAVSYNLIKEIDEYPTAPDVTANKGWKFIGWFDGDDNEYDLSGTVPNDAEDAAYTAKYKEKAEDRITVTFDVG